MTDITGTITTKPVAWPDELRHFLRTDEIRAIEDGEDHPLLDESTTLLNFGPAHPSTHGVLRLVTLIRGETIVAAAPVIGYLHTGIEKTAESLTYMQAGTAVTRMDYASCFFNELALALAIEQLLDIDIPARATWIRMLLSELNRISSHLLYLATGGMEIGAISMMIYGWREREEILRFFQKLTGLRMNHNFIRPGGVAADLHTGWKGEVSAILDMLTKSLVEYETLLSGQPIWRNRLQGVAELRPADAVALAATGPVLRGSGVANDIRRTQPYLAYDEVEFDVLVGSYGDAYDRYAVRIGEIRESMRIIEQVMNRLPQGDYRSQDKKVTPPPRARIDESMEALIHHFKIFTEGMKVPEGEVYVAVESPRGELGCYLVSDGSANPRRLHIKAPSFSNLQTLPAMLHGHLVADVITAISSVDPVMGDVDR